MGVIAGIALTGSAAVIAHQDDHGKNFGSWRLSGFDNHNTSNSSAISRLNSSNVGDLDIKWIYNIPPIDITPAVPCNYTGISTLPCPIPLGANPINQNRPYYGAAGTGVAVDRKGRVYFPTYDGRFFILDSKNTSGLLNADGTASPNVLKTLDFYSDPQFVIPGQLPEENVYVSRTFPTLMGKSTFAGNYGFYGVRVADGSGNWHTMAAHTANPTDPFYRSAGAVLYNLDRRTGKLIWKTVVDDQSAGSIPATGVTPIYNTQNGDIVVVPFTVSNPSGTMGGFKLPAVLTSTNDPFGGHCCDNRGGLAGVRVSDGKVVWKTYSMPSQNFLDTLGVVAAGKVNAWTGGNSWGGGNLPYSKKLKLVFAGTSEAYSAPVAAAQCEASRLTNPLEPRDSNKCLQYDQSGLRTDLNYNRNFSNNVLESTSPKTYSPTLPFANTVYAVDVNTGKIKWAQPVNGFDIWNTSCLQYLGAAFFNGSYFCSADLVTNPLLQLQSKDKDAATAPTLIENVKMADGKTRDVLVGGGKGATMYAFDAKTGEPLWQPAPVNLAAYPTDVPAGVHFGNGGIDGGGFVWGFATNGKKIYGVTGASSDLSLAEWKTARDGGPNPKRVVVNSCIESGFYTANPADPNQSDSNKIWGGSSFAAFTRGTGTGGMYVSVNLADGSVAWQRCALGLQGAPNRTLTTTTPVADCIAGNGVAASSPGDSCVPRTTNAGPTLANDVLIVSGTNNYQDGSGLGVSNLYPFPEVLLLDAKTGKLLRELPLGVLGQPAANEVVYNRSISVGKNLFISTGSRKVSSGASPDPTRNFYRVIMYHLTSDHDEYSDDNDNDNIREDDQ